jgi:hypothetical protein
MSFFISASYCFGNGLRWNTDKISCLALIVFLKLFLAQNYFFNVFWLFRCTNIKNNFFKKNILFLYICKTHF